MKKIMTIYAALIMTANVFAQSPNKMSYQAVIRNASNALVANQAVGMRISILQGTASGTAVYVETQTPTTNANGLASIEIGGGSVNTGTFAAINWANGPYFIKTETDPVGSTNYSIIGTSQLLSVPYALHAKNTDTWQMKTDTVFTNHKVMINDNSSARDLELKVEGDYNPLISFNRTNSSLYTNRDWWLYPTANGSFNIRDNTSGTNPFVIDINGNVGIGLQNPSQLLSVGGTIMSSHNTIPRLQFNQISTNQNIYMGISNNMINTYGIIQNNAQNNAQKLCHSFFLYI